MNIYQSVIAFINSIPVGGQFTTKQFHKYMADLGYRDGYQPSYRINTYRTYLRSAGFVTNTSRGNWRVNYHVPVWLTLSALETARNYKGTQAQRKAIKAKINEYQSTISAKVAVAPFKVGDKVIYTPNPKSHYDNSDYYAEKAGLIPGGEYQIGTISKHAHKQDCWWVTIKGRSFSLAHDCFVPALTVKVKAEAPKPKRQAVCIDMSDSSAEYIIGNVYEITDEDELYYFFKDRTGGMFKWRFKEITGVKVVEPKKSAYTIKVLCTNSKGYRMTLTEGKTYMAKYSSGEGKDELYAIETNDRGDKAGYTIAFKHRFTILTDEVVETPKPEVFKSPFKVGDTVRFLKSKIHSSFYEHASHYTRLTDNGEYKVTGISENGHGKWKNMFIDVAGCEYHHPYDCFELVVIEPMPENKTWKYGDKFIAHNDRSIIYTLEESTYPSAVTVTWDEDGETRENIGYNAEEVTKYFKEGVWTLVKGGSKPVETPKQSEYNIEVVCLDNGGYAGRLTIGKTYMVKGNDNAKLYSVETDDKANKPGYTVAYKSRFLVVTEEVVKPEVVEPTEDQFTVGVIFTESGDKHEIEYMIKEITPVGITLQWKSRAGKICSYTVKSTYFTNPYPNRFKIVEQKIKVGHKISCYFLNDLKKPKKLYGNGFRMKWETTYGNHFGMEHRTIEEIDIVDGVWAGRLSGTAGIWIALDSLK